MPRILPTFAAIAIVGVCIAFNTMRYPIVWEMVGPQAQTSFSEKHASSSETIAPAKVESPASTAQNASPPTDSAAKPEPEPLVKETIAKEPLAKELPAKEIEKPDVTQAIPIPLPNEDYAASKAKLDAERQDQSENNGMSSGDENLVEPPRRLVPVAGETAAPAVQPQNFRRLPPVEAEIVTPAARYAGENANYPSTGK